MKKVNYSIVIPAFNEANQLPKTLQSVRNAMNAVEGVGQLIVTDNNSTDATAAVAREWGAEVVYEPINQISRARNRGASIAVGEYLVFLDADTELPSLLLKQALKSIKSGECCGGGALIRLDTEVSGLPAFCLNLWNWIAKTYKLGAGSFLFTTKEAFEAVGGFSEDVYASEEIWFSKRIKAWGRKTERPTFAILEQHPVITSSRKMDQPVKMWGMLFFMLIFPFAVRFRALCWYWYKRSE